MRLLLDIFFHAPARLLAAFHRIGQRQDVPGACRFCGERAVGDGDRCDECRDTVVL